MSYLLPQFKCQPDAFSAHFKTISHFARNKEPICFRVQCSLSTTATTETSTSTGTALLDLEKIRLLSLDAHTDVLSTEKSWGYFGTMESTKERVNFGSTLSTETLITDEAVVAAAAAEAIALARAAAKVAKDAARMVDNAYAAKEDTKSYSSSSNDPSINRWPRLTEVERAHILDDSTVANADQRSEYCLKYSELDILDPTHEELELLENQISDAVTVKSRRHTERKAKRARATEKSITNFLSLKLGPTSKKKRASMQDVDYSDPLRYLRGTTATSKLLTSREELQLSEGIQDLLKLEKLQQEILERSGVEPSFAQWAAAVGVDQKTLRKRLNNGINCKDKMIKSNIRLVISIAKRYQGAGMNLQDLVQEGCRGLVRGAEKFDASKGFKFSTYAHWWIKQSVRKSLSDQSRTIRLPFHVVEASYRVKEARKVLQFSKGRPPSDEEIAQATGLSMKRLSTVLLAPKSTLSLDQKMGINMDLKPSEVVADPDAELSEDVLMKQFMKQDLDKVLNSLNPRENKVVRWRFGLEDGRMKTLQEIGEIMGVSRERIRQIELSAFRKLKNKKRTKHLTQYVTS